MDIYTLMRPGEAQDIVNAVLHEQWYQGQTADGESAGEIKKNLELGRAHNSEVVTKELHKLRQKLAKHKLINQDQHIYKVAMPKFNRYDAPDRLLDSDAKHKGKAGEYQRHGDAAFMGDVRADLACTIFLTHPNLYEGGVLYCEQEDGSTWSHKGAPGTCVVYDCHWPHWVTPVTKGFRISAITWLQSTFRDLEQRTLIRRFSKYAIEARKLDNQLGVSLGTATSKLVRMWAER